MVDHAYELRRLRRHLSVQENRVRAAKTDLDKLGSRLVSAAWRARAELVYAEAVKGRDGFLKKIEKLEAEINGEAENERSENGGPSDEEVTERTEGQPDRPSALCDRKETETYRSPAEPSTASKT